MSKTQSHFVVVFDHATGEFSIDWDTTLTRFDDGLHFKDDDWVTVDGLDDKEFVNFDAACEILTNILFDCPGVDVEE